MVTWAAANPAEARNRKTNELTRRAWRMIDPVKWRLCIAMRKARRFLRNFSRTEPRASARGLRAAQNRRGRTNELLDRRHRLLHLTQVLLSGRIVARAHRQRDRPLLAVQPLLGIAD